MANEVSKIYSDIAELLNVARAKAYHTVNSIMVETYWKIGQRIVKKNRAEVQEPNTEQNLLRICLNTSQILLAKVFQKPI